MRLEKSTYGCGDAVILPAHDRARVRVMKALPGKVLVLAVLDCRPSRGLTRPIDYPGQPSNFYQVD